MMAEASKISHIRLPSSLPWEGPLNLLTPERASSVLVLDAYLGLLRMWDGPGHHELLRSWLTEGEFLHGDLREWMLNQLPQAPLRPKLLDRARTQAEERLRQGIAVASLPGSFSGNPSGHSLPKCSSPLNDRQHPGAPCPAVLYLKGNGAHLLTGWGSNEDARTAGTGSRTPPLAAFFNSRKPRHMGTAEPWLQALRSSLHHTASAGSPMGIVTSLGTLTHDLTAAFAILADIPLFLVLPSFLEEAAGPSVASQTGPFLHHSLAGGAVLACRTRSLSCPKALAMKCRDRLLAHLADLHWILEIRAGGNLLEILRRRRLARPHYRYVFVPPAIGPGNEGNRLLMDERPEAPSPFQMDVLFQLDSSRSQPTGEETSWTAMPETPQLLHRSSSFSGKAGQRIDWARFLFHYTRSRPGPWPGQSYEDYLHSLLGDDPLKAHTAADTLIRILNEGRLRATSGLIRGNVQVLSWTAIPPHELGIIRQWNPALIRWTFEPYGIAVSREYLKKRGVKPAIYGPRDAYERLRPRDRYRFQRHEPPRCAWRQEREWRLDSDLPLDGIPAGDWLVFVPGETDASRIAQYSDAWPLAVL